MVNYTLHYTNDGIEITGNGRSIIKNLLNQNGSSVDITGGNSKAAIIEFQKELNYLDSRKDFTGASILYSLNIYPLLNERTPTYPEDLDTIEKIILNSVSGYLHHTTWIKVKKHSPLTEQKTFNKVLWESGLGPSCFIEQGYSTVKTFGSYIDPLEKQTAQEVWPPNGDKIVITPNFMELMGFGKSSLEATTIGTSNFNYKMVIKCGTDCSNNNGCTVEHTVRRDNTDPNSKYFKGNRTKKDFLSTSGSGMGHEKIKYIVLKEWGDKMQVLIYLILLQYLGSQSAIMTTCDKVVLVFCIILGIPCIYTGAYTPPGRRMLNDGKKYYSVLEYQPSLTPYADAAKRFNEQRAKIIHENDGYITLIGSLVTNPDTPIFIGGDSPTTFPPKFYEAIEADMIAINANLVRDMIEITDMREGSGTIAQVETDIRTIEQKYTIVPMIKIKKGTTNQLIMLMTKSYTLEKPSNAKKPNIKEYLKSIRQSEQSEQIVNKIANKSFYEIGRHIHLILNTQSGGSNKKSKMYGGIAEIYKFPNDDFNTDNEYKLEYLQDDCELGEDKDIEDVKPIDYQKILDDSFNSSFEEWVRVRGGDLNGIIDNFNKEIFNDTLYSLFLYNSLIEHLVCPDVTLEDIEYLVKTYIEVDVPVIVGSIERPLLRVPYKQPVQAISPSVSIKNESSVSAAPVPPASAPASAPFIRTQFRTAPAAPVPPAPSPTASILTVPNRKRKIEPEPAAASAPAPPAPSPTASFLTAPFRTITELFRTNGTKRKYRSIAPTITAYGGTIKKLQNKVKKTKRIKNPKHTKKYTRKNRK